MNKKGKTNPEQFQISARHSCYSMLPVENKVQGKKRQRLSFRPQEGQLYVPFSDTMPSFMIS